MSNRDILIYGATGLGVWLHGAVTFRLGGHVLFQNGPLMTLAVALIIAALVCLALRLTMRWRRAPPSQAVIIAVVMATPGLFAEAARQLAFPWATGLPVSQASTFAAVIFFGNAALLTYALLTARRAQAER
jgi:hypothetical protein